MARFELLIDANFAALDVHDRHGLMPVHWLCNAACTGGGAGDSRRAAGGARRTDVHGQP